MGLLNLTRWPWPFVVILAGLAAIALALLSLNLFRQAMANIRFLREYGWIAVEVGALVQLAQLIIWGLCTLLAYLVFKACEVELVFRYFGWARGLRKDMSGMRKLRFRRDDTDDT